MGGIVGRRGPFYRDPGEQRGDHAYEDDDPSKATGELILLPLLFPEASFRALSKVAKALNLSVPELILQAVRNQVLDKLREEAKQGREG